MEYVRGGELFVKVAKGRLKEEGLLENISSN
ncbi:hypothetical protein NC652_017993 [Populus alba x Populus x berolinensis]|nr:hypothetical protein NC652_017993 [Populus alba x Populus x berolinensis]